MLRDPIRYGKYLLLDRISVGGMAEVFKAKSFGVEGFEKILAIKRILPTMVEDSDFIDMFVDEAKIAGLLNHANICQIYELGRIERSHYIAMEYIPGKDLLQIMSYFQRRKQLMPVPVACFICTKLCEGLDYAHRKGDPGGRALNIIHRDVSPQNVLVSFEGEIKLIDFGIAKARYRSSKTAAGVLKGKFGYMSPEQVRGLKLDRRSDVFALGTLLYEMTTGVRLFVGESDFATLEKVRNVDVPPPRRHNPHIPKPLETLILQALSRAPEDRFQWANEMQEALQGFMLNQKPLMTTKRLAAWMKEYFAEEIRRERAEHERYMALKVEPTGITQPDGGNGRSRQLPDFDAFEDDEETNLMPERSAEDFGEEDPTRAEGPQGMASDRTMILEGEDGVGELEDATVILFSSDEEEDATMILPSDDGESFMPVQLLAPNGNVPDQPTMILPPGEEAPDGATMILPPDGDAPEGATMILPPDEVVEGIPVGDAGAVAPQPAAAPSLPSDLPPPPKEEDIFGSSLKATSTPTPSVAQAAPQPGVAGPRSILGYVIVGLASAILVGGLVALIMALARPKPRRVSSAAKTPPSSATVLTSRSLDVQVILDKKRLGSTGTRGAFLLKKLTAGKHTLTLSAPHHEPLTLPFEVKAGNSVLLGPYSLRQTAQPSNLTVSLARAFRDADIWVGDKLIAPDKVGKPIPMPIDQKVQLKVTMLGYDDYVETIETSHDQDLKVQNITLTRSKRGQVRLESEPLGASIRINGKEHKCLTPCRIKDLSLKKKFTVKLSLDGYDVYEQEYGFFKRKRTRVIRIKLKKATAPPPPMTADAGMTAVPGFVATLPMEAPEARARPTRSRPRATRYRPRSFRVALPGSGRSRPRPRTASSGGKCRGRRGSLVANTIPWSRVYVNGRNTRRSTPIPPVAALKLRAGRHKVTFITKAGKKYNFYVTITACKTTRLIRRLK